MLITKQGIYREIPESKFPEFKVKGFTLVQEGAPKKGASDQKKGAPKKGA